MVLVNSLIDSLIFLNLSNTFLKNYNKNKKVKRQSRIAKVSKTIFNLILKTYATFFRFFKNLIFKQKIRNSCQIVMISTRTKLLVFTAIQIKFSCKKLFLSNIISLVYRLPIICELLWPK